MRPSSKVQDYISITPGFTLQGEVGFGTTHQLPGDKSLSHRAALLAALANGASRIENFLVSGVTRAMLSALTDLGVPWELEGTTLRVEGQGIGRLSLAERRGMRAVEIDCGNSATTMRLLAGGLAAWGRAASLDGSPGLRRRPMNRIVEPLQSMGVTIQSDHGCAPLTISPSALPLRAIRYSLPVASAQVKSCLLLAALAADSATTLLEPGPSRDHTERMLRAMGVPVTTFRSDQYPSEDHAATVSNSPISQYGTRLEPPFDGNLSPLNTKLPGDISAASFLIVGALVTPGSHLVLKGVGLNPTRTGLLDALRQMGASISITNQEEIGGEPIGDLTVAYSQLQGIRVTGDLVVRMIDEFPIFAVASAFSSGTTVVADALELRHKESDRISMLCCELINVGVDAKETVDGFVIHGGRRPRGGTVDAHGDHRLAMSLAVAGLATEQPILVQQASIIAESFPDFTRLLTELGAEIKEG